MLAMKALRLKWINSRSAGQRRKALRLRILGSLCLCSALVACGVQVGTQPYVSDCNVGPQSEQYKEYQQNPPSQQRRYARQNPPPHQYTEGTLVMQDISSVVQTMRGQIGVPYRYGGATPKGFDCSGLIQWSYRQHGISVPRVARAQANFGSPVNRNMLKPGDIVAFKVRGAYHTGVYSGNGYFIHSPSRGRKVREESLNTPYWQRVYIGARRIY